jgi:hypothetical protein
MGRPDFYREVAERLRACDLIVAEGADAASSTGMAYVIALKATRQWGANGLVHQDIDYGALGVPVVWPENLVKAKRRRHRMLWIEWFGVVLLTPALIIASAVGGRDYLLRRNLEISDDHEVRLRFLSKWIIDERDAQLIAALTDVHERRCAEPIVVAVVYGAAHMPAVVRALTNLGYRARSAEWVTVFSSLT